MIYLLAGLGVISRLIPHWPNFVPIGSIGIFASNKKGILTSALIVLAVMVITDIFLGFSFVSFFVYTGMLSYVFWGQLSRRGTLGMLGAPIGGSISFFIISNLGVWLGPWYTHDLTGFIRCFTLAIPFYKFTLFSDIIFTAAIFAIYALVVKYKTGGLRVQRKPNEKEIRWHSRLLKASLNKK